MRILIGLLLLSHMTYGATLTQYMHNKSGINHVQKGEYLESEKSFSKVLKSAPNSGVAMHNLGLSFSMQNRFEEAVPLFSESIGRLSSEQQSEALYNLATSYLGQQKLDEAKSLYQEVLRRNPSDLDAKKNLEFLLKMEKQDDQSQSSKEDDKDEQNKESEDKDGEGKDSENNNESQDTKADEGEKEAQKEKTEQTLSLEQAKQILDALSQHEKEAKKRHRVKAAQEGTIENDW